MAGPGQRDLPWAWPVALACCWIAFCNTGIYRASGVIYVQIVNVFGVSRQMASWPFSLFGAVSSFSGILPGILVRWLTIRQVVLLGSTISVLGVVTCAMAPSVPWIAFCFGIVSGFGSGLIMTLLPVILNQYFYINRATASGVFLSGSTLSLLVLPSLSGLLLDTYTLHGTFLVLGGVVMNIFVGALLLRPLPPPSTAYLVTNDGNQKGSIKDKDGKCCPCPTVDSLMALVKDCAQILSSPMFLLITFCSLISRNVLVTFSMVLVDYAVDKSLSTTQGTLLVSAVALPELLGRLGSGWLSDHKYVSRKCVFFGAQLVSGVALALLTLARATWLLFLLSATFALANAAAFILINVFYLEYLGIERLPLALSLKNVFMGLSSLLRPTIVGVFRDYICSYDHLFHLFAAVSVAAGAVWWLEPLLVKKAHNQTKDCDNKD